MTDKVCGVSEFADRVEFQGWHTSSEHGGNCAPLSPDIVLCTCASLPFVCMLSNKTVIFNVEPP